MGDLRERTFNVTYTINNGRGETKSFKTKVFFGGKANDYGNGYYMGIKGVGEPFGSQGYDIRYDSSFNIDRAISYIADFYERRYDGKNGAWSLIGIRIFEADESEDEE